MGMRGRFGFVGPGETVGPIRYFVNLMIFLVVFLVLDGVVGSFTENGRSVEPSSLLIGMAIGVAFAYGPRLIRRAAK